MDTSLCMTSPYTTVTTIQTATSVNRSLAWQLPPSYQWNHAGLYRGYGTFVLSIGMIAFCTALISDVAGHLGCFIFLKDSVNAIAFVALGTSIPGSLTTDGCEASVLHLRVGQRKEAFARMFNGLDQCSMLNAICLADSFNPHLLNVSHP